MAAPATASATQDQPPTWLNNPAAVKKVDWKTRQIDAVPSHFENYDPATGTVVGTYATLAQAGAAISKLRSYGQI